MLSNDMNTGFILALEGSGSGSSGEIPNYTIDKGISI